MSEDGLTRSAILMLSLGEAQAAEVMKHLAPREVQKLGQAMARLKDVSREKIGKVLDAFRTEAEERTSLGAGSAEYVKSVLTRALGDDKASAVIERILQEGDAAGIEGLKWMDAPAVAGLIGNEHPQIVATILVHLDRDQAAEVMKLLPERLRNDVVLRIATLEGIQPAALRELNEVLQRLLTGGGGGKAAPRGGIKAAAEIVNRLGSAIETGVIEAVRQHDAELAQKILDQMFVFENLLDLDDRAIQLLLREVQSESLIVALKGASEELRQKVFKNMSQRAGEMLKEDLEAKGPVRVSEVETQQKEILRIVRRLADEGQVAIGGGGEGSYV
ncbi:MAG: flagellar motor switch protein FliG [Burkholderiales bacterium]|nr:flagellar motor switch protein FliG [Burkholderiales bacterium]